MTTDLVARDLDGEDVAKRGEAHDDFYLSAYRTHLSFYERQYEFWGNPAIMTIKIGANNILYGAPTPCSSSIASSPTSI